MKKLLILLLLTLILVGCKNDNNMTFNEDFPGMEKKVHVYKKSTYTTSLNLILEGTGVLLITYDSNKAKCPYTNQIIPILNEAAIENDFDVIHYLDIYEMQQENNSEYRLLLGYLDSQVGDIQTHSGNKRLGVPDVYFIKEGKIIGHHLSTIPNKNGDYIKELNSNQKQDLKKIYGKLFSSLK